MCLMTYPARDMTDSEADDSNPDTDDSADSALDLPLRGARCNAPLLAKREEVGALRAHAAALRSRLEATGLLAEHARLGTELAKAERLRGVRRHPTPPPPPPPPPFASPSPCLLLPLFSS